MIKSQLQKLITEHALKLGFSPLPEINIEAPKVLEHGDFSTNIAFLLAKSLRKPPQEIAQQLQKSLESESFFKKIEFKAPGFLNFFLHPQAYHEALLAFYDHGKITLPQSGKGQRVMVEFVSANPTGPMHVGHGRNAVVGDCLARLLTSVGYEVTREFYVNDHGVQIKTLGTSGDFYFQKLTNPSQAATELPTDMYRGDYLESLVAEHLEEIRACNGDPLKIGKRLGVELLKKIVVDLRDLGVTFDRYSPESRLYSEGQIERSLQKLKDNQKTYEEDGALWFRTTEYGDDKDRVLIKKDGNYTYFTPDIAYHQSKFEEGFDLYVNVMGSDHAGYLARLKAAMAALGYDPKKLEFLLMQMVSLKRNGENVSMSKRSGDYVTLREVVDEVGKDAARFFLMMRSPNVTLEFDLELAKKQSSDNPVYYLQYAHARICSIFEKAKVATAPIQNLSQLAEINLPEEIELIKLILNYPEILAQAVQHREAHRIVFYLLELVKTFQNYYTQGNTDARYRILSEDGANPARLFLLEILRKVLQSGFEILGISAPEKM